MSAPRPSGCDNDAILPTDSSHGGARDLSAVIAGKKAVKQATNGLADTFLYSLADRWHDRAWELPCVE